jgi:transcriptional regulator with XRE-family HTH domain
VRRDARLPRLPILQDKQAPRQDSAGCPFATIAVKSGGAFVARKRDMQTIDFDSLRDLVLHYGARRGWQTQRQIAVMCGIDETGLSRFLNGEQDIGARRTHALFQAVGVPVDRYDLAYALLGRAQEQARADREARLARVDAVAPARIPVGRGVERGRASHTPEMLLRTPSFRGQGAWSVPMPVDSVPATGVWYEPDLPAAVVVALFASKGYSGEQIAAFFAVQEVGPALSAPV